MFFNFGSNYFEDYINFNKKIFQNSLDGLNVKGFYIMLNGVLDMMNSAPNLMSSAYNPNGTTGAGKQTARSVRFLMNLQEIENALTGLRLASASNDAEDFEDKEPMSDDIVRRMMSGYAYVNDLLRDDVDLFTYGNSHHWLELNHLVLCGTTPERREQFRNHIELTEKRFYDDSKGGIGERIEWLQRHRTSTPEAVAAGIFLLITSSPQLYIEGNRRTATLIASYALVRHGLSPVVVTAKDYKEFFEVADTCKNIDRSRWDQTLTIRRETGRIEQFMRNSADPGYLVQTADADSAGH